MKKLFSILLVCFSFSLFAETLEYKVVTNFGEIDIELYRKVAPKTVTNFDLLVGKGFFDKTYFHRIIENFMIQAGDPNTKDSDRSNDGQGNCGRKFRNEISAKSLGLDTLKLIDTKIGSEIPDNHPFASYTVETYLEKKGFHFKNNLKSLHNDYSYISMANSGPGTNSCQFFIISKKDNARWLDGKHTVFGKVTKGMNIVHEIEKVSVDEKENPLKEDRIEIIKIIKK